MSSPEDQSGGDLPFTTADRAVLNQLLQPLNDREASRPALPVGVGGALLHALAENSDEAWSNYMRGEGMNFGVPVVGELHDLASSSVYLMPRSKDLVGHEQVEQVLGYNLGGLFAILGLPKEGSAIERTQKSDLPVYVFRSEFPRDAADPGMLAYTLASAPQLHALQAAQTPTKQLAVVEQMKQLQPVYGAETSLIVGRGQGAWLPRSFGEALDKRVGAIGREQVEVIVMSSGTMGFIDIASARNKLHAAASVTVSQKG